MGLLEYQTMPSLDDVAHDGVLCAFAFSIIDLPYTGANHHHDVVRQGAGGMDRPSRSKSHPAGPLCNQPGWPPCWTGPLAFGLIE
jgi:hypothetical protein